MKILAGLVLLLALTCPQLLAEEVHKPGKGAEVEIAGWGIALAPDGDCSFTVKEGEVQITVPGGEPHDFAPERKRVNAPRVLQAVKGDFAIQVKIDGPLETVDQSTPAGDTGYRAAAIVIVLDSDNIITLARAAHLNPGEKTRGYANFELRSNGRVQRYGNADDMPLPVAGPVYLRLERRGRTVKGKVSEDGKEWTTLPFKQLPSFWLDEVEVGIMAANSAKLELAPRFSELRVEQLAAEAGK